jgi:hypothetical protein
MFCLESSIWNARTKTFTSKELGSEGQGMKNELKTSIGPRKTSNPVSEVDVRVKAVCTSEVL